MLQTQTPLSCSNLKQHDLIAHSHCMSIAGLMEALPSADLTPGLRPRKRPLPIMLPVSEAEKRVWQLTSWLLKLPPENDNHHFCASAIGQSTSVVMSNFGGE